MVKVYIASPYKLGDKEANVRAQLEAADVLISHGFNVYIPLLFHYMDLQFPKSENVWLRLVMEWVGDCNCILRLPGFSDGASKERRRAHRLGMKVFYSIKELLEYYA